METLTLEQAIANTVAGFVASSKSFSGWDVVKLLRERMRTGDLEIPELPVRTTYDGSTKMSELYSTNVRHPIATLFKDGKMPGYTEEQVTKDARRFTQYTAPVKIPSQPEEIDL